MGDHIVAAVHRLDISEIVGTIYKRHVTDWLGFNFKVVYREPVTGPQSPGIVHRKSNINNKLASKPAPKPAPEPTPKLTPNPTLTLHLYPYHTLTLTLALPNPNS